MISPTLLFQALSSVYKQSLEWDCIGTTAKQQCQEVCVSPLNLVIIHQFRVRSSSTVQEVHYPEWDLHDKCM